MISRNEFGRLPDGREVEKYRISNHKGEYVEFLNYGATIQSLYLLDINGNLSDVLLGTTNAADLAGRVMGGFVVGRVANRIAYGKFSLEGKDIQLETNPRDGNYVHGESGNYAHMMFAVIASNESDTINFHFYDQGYAGFHIPVDVNVIYSFGDDDVLKIHYIMKPYGTTLLCPTNHAYFNLGDYKNVKEQYLHIYSDYIALKGPSGAPEGGLVPVAGTPWDFTSFRKIGDALDSDPKYQYFNPENPLEYDDFYLINGSGMRKFAEYYSSDSKRFMTVKSDMDSLILFTPSKCAEKKPKYGNLPYPKYAAVCLETQFVPNAVNCTEFRSPIFHIGEELDTTTEYKFELRDSL